MDRANDDKAEARVPLARAPVRVALVVLGFSVAMLVAIPSWWFSRRPHVDVGAVPTPRPPATTKARFDPTAPAVPAIAVHSARLADQHPARSAATPVGVRIPAAGVDASVIPVGIDFSTDTVQVPADVRQVGWYRFGPSPGEPGSAVLLGHVDSAAQGPGSFFRLRQVQPGARIFVRFQNMSTATFRAVARRSYAKGALPASLFSRSGSPVLALITCGGSFDSVTRHYADNVVIYAVKN